MTIPLSALSHKIYCACLIWENTYLSSYRASLNCLRIVQTRRPIKPELWPAILVLGMQVLNYVLSALWASAKYWKRGYKFFIAISSSAFFVLQIVSWFFFLAIFEPILGSSHLHVSSQLRARRGKETFWAKHAFFDSNSVVFFYQKRFEKQVRPKDSDVFFPLGGDQVHTTSS